MSLKAKRARLLPWLEGRIERQRARGEKRMHVMRFSPHVTGAAPD